MKCEYLTWRNGSSEVCFEEATERSRADLDGEEIFVCRKHAEERACELAGQFRSWCESELRKIADELSAGQASPERRRQLLARHDAIVQEAGSFLTRLVSRE